MILNKLKKLQPYLKDLIAISILFFLAWMFYEKPSVNIKVKPKDAKIEQTNLENIQQTEEQSEIAKSINIFKEIDDIEEIEQPTFKEVLFGEKKGNITLIAIVGTKKEMRALVLDHTNNLRELKKGEKIENEVVVSLISDTFVRFKSGNKIKDLYLYKKHDNISRNVPEVPPPFIPSMEQMNIAPEEEQSMNPEEMTELRRGRLR